MNRSDLRNLTLYWLDDLEGGYFTPTQVNLWMNLAQREVQKRLLQAGNNRYLKCVTTPLVINQGDYVLPDDFMKLHRLEVIVSGTYPNESSYVVSPITLNQKDMVLSLSGTVQCYYLKKNRITLKPVPSDTYTLRMWYSYRVDDMLTDVEIPDIPDEYQELIALMAAEDGFIKDDRENSKVKQKLMDFQTMLDTDAQERQVDVPRQIVQTGWDDEGTYEW